MRSPDDISIQRAILHKINPRINNGFVLSEGCMPVGQQHPVSLFLAAHIKSALHDTSLRAATFKAGQNSLIHDYTQVIKGRKDFVKTTQAFATTLHDLISKDKRISTGGLAFCFYKSSNDNFSERYLAVLKLDQGDGFSLLTDKDAKGRNIVTLAPQKDMMPRTSERLQKCAFVRPLDPRPSDFDLMVLDRQQGEDEPAQFFTDSFLSAGLAADPSLLTKRFHSAAFSGLNAVRRDIGQTDYESIRMAIDGAIHAVSIDIDDWGKKLRATSIAKSSVMSSIKAAIPDATIETDAATAAALTKKRVIRGQHGLKLVFESAHADDILTSCTEKKDPNKGDYHELILHVRNFHEER